jgi:hypothetical protein
MICCIAKAVERASAQLLHFATYVVDNGNNGCPLRHPHEREVPFRRTKGERSTDLRAGLRNEAPIA